MNATRLKVLFVCLGNICRSPLAEGVFRHMVKSAGLEDRFEIDSAGTSSYHIGDPPDTRTTQVARARGIELTGAARQVRVDDLQHYDYVIAMDEENYTNIKKLARRGVMANVHLLREFDATADDDDRGVPDPYYGGPRGFENVHDIVDRSCAELLRYIRDVHGL